MSHYCTMYPRVRINIQGATRATLRALVPVRSFSSLNYRESHGRPSVEASLSPPLSFPPLLFLPLPPFVYSFFLSFFLTGVREEAREAADVGRPISFSRVNATTVFLYFLFSKRERKEIGFYKSGLRGMERDGERTLGSRKMHRARG